MELPEPIPESADNATNDQNKTIKPLPPGYICKACGMKDDHAIYNCSLYKPKKRQIPKSKFFMWKLSHGITSTRIKDWLSENGIEGFMEVTLVMDKIKDECKGVGIVTVETSQSDAILALNGSTLDGRVFNIKVDDKPQREEATKSKKLKRCYRCGGDHEPSACTNDRICYKCKSSDHISSECPIKRRRTGDAS